MSAQPGADKTSVRGRRWQKSPVTGRSPGRARRKPLKPLRAGMPGDSGVLVVTRVRSTTTKCTRNRGCNGHPAFPTPSVFLGREINVTPRALRAARAKSYAGLYQRHCEERKRRSNPYFLCGKMDCFARARNDGRHTTLSAVIIRESG